MVDKCIAVLLTLLESRISYVVQEAIVVIRDIFRRYPGKYTSVIVPMCGVIDLLDEAEARACIIWVIGEYSNVIDSAGELLGLFLDSYHDEKPVVQLQLLTAAVKLFLRRPDAGKDVMTSLLTVATAETLSVDMRDRAYLFVRWR